jgi:hypothetical protein
MSELLVQAGVGSELEVVRYIQTQVVPLGVAECFIINSLDSSRLSEYRIKEILCTECHFPIFG